MHLLIDTVSIPAAYILFNPWKGIVCQDFLELKGRESEYFLDSLLEFLDKNKLEFQNLEGVVVVNGPGSFTAMRIITLTINTLSFVHHTSLYGIDYFVLWEVSGWSYPMLVRANRWEYLMKKDRDSLPAIVAIQDIHAGNYSGIGDINDFTNTLISIQSTLPYEVFCRNFQVKNPIRRIEPFYIKKPNIT